MANGNQTSGTLSRPAVPQPVRLRRNIAKLPLDDPIVLFYGRAIDEMRKKPLVDPTSWRYQAAIHDYPVPGSTFAERRAADPFATTSETLPSATEQRRFWRQCQHSTWYFLPWHRMYLHHFEKMIMDHVIRLGGPADWALPYWNYSENAAAGLFPRALGNRTLPDGSPNPLFIEQRDPDANLGRPFANAGQTDASAALGQPAYSAPGSGASFGGPKTVFNHSTGSMGVLEGTPHGTMHMAVSGPARADPSIDPAFPDPAAPGGVRRGFMANFVRAPLDPIFWIHHCNIDRLWTEWLRGPGHTNPTTDDWLKSVSFSFHNAAGAIEDMTPSQVIDSHAPLLSYAYDDEPISPTRP